MCIFKQKLFLNDIMYICVYKLVKNAICFQQICQILAEIKYFLLNDYLFTFQFRFNVYNNI